MRDAFVIAVTGCSTALVTRSSVPYYCPGNDEAAVDNEPADRKSLVIGGTICVVPSQGLILASLRCLGWLCGAASCSCEGWSATGSRTVVLRRRGTGRYDVGGRLGGLWGRPVGTGGVLLRLVCRFQRPLLRCEDRARMRGWESRGPPCRSGCRPWITKGSVRDSLLSMGNLRPHRHNPRATGGEVHWGMPPEHRKSVGVLRGRFKGTRIVGAEDTGYSYEYE